MQTFLLVLVAGLGLQAAPAADVSATIDQIVEQEMARQGAVGIAVGAVKDGMVIHTKGYGFADRERDIPVTTSTMFRWASISKPLTAVVAAQLALEGKLDLDKDIRQYVPEFPEKDPDHPITTRLLLGHLGGIVHYSNGPVIPTVRRYESKHPYEDVILSLDTFNNSPLVSEPGATFNYSTRGFMLASAVAERAGAAPFHALVQERIAKPLGLTTLQPDYQWEEIPNRAVGYRKLGALIVPSSNTDVSWKLGGGGFISSITDLTAFAQALTDQKFMTPELRELLWTPQTTSGGRQTSYGLGFTVKTVDDDRLLIRHSGAQEKTRTIMVVFPDDGIAVTVMTNSEYGKPLPIAHLVAEALFGEQSADSAP